MENNIEKICGLYIKDILIPASYALQETGRIEEREIKNEIVNINKTIMDVIDLGLGKTSIIFDIRHPKTINILQQNGYKVYQKYPEEYWIIDWSDKNDKCE